MRTRLRATFFVSSLLVTAALLHASPQQAAVATAAPSLSTAADQQFTTDGVTVRYRDLGSGDPIIFIHGYTSSIEGMLGIANALPPDYRKVALDIRGFGKSSKFSDEARFGKGMVDDVIHLMDQLKIQKAHLVGHSMGALIAANVLAQHPERVESAALVAGPFWDAQQMNTDAKRWTTELENGNGLLNFFQWLIPGMNPQMAAATNAGLMKSNDLGSLIASMRALPTLTITGLAKDGAKTLLVAGSNDPLSPTSAAFAKNTPGSKLLEIQGANHVTVITNPETVKAITAQISQ